MVKLEEEGAAAKKKGGEAGGGTGEKRKINKREGRQFVFFLICLLPTQRKRNF